MRYLQFIRTYASAFAYWLMIGVALWLTFGDPEYRFSLGLLALSLAIIFFSLIDQGRRIRFVYDTLVKSGANRIGTALGFCGYPRPGTSMISQLQRQAGVYPSDITAIYLQTYSLENGYLGDFANYLKGVANSGSIEITVIGAGENTKDCPLRKVFEKVKILQSKETLIEHFNLIKTDKGLFAWYEPKHIEHEKHYIPEKGAMLIQVENEEEAFEHYYSKKAA